MSDAEAPILGQAAGYGVVVGLGLAFAVIMLGITKMQGRYTSHSPSNAEEFNSASRSVKPGLIATGIVSAWTWAATLLQSSAVAYKFGLSGTYAYSAGACVQVLLFAMLAAKLKLNAPGASTYIQIIRARWGTAAHIIFLFFGLLTNVIVSLMLVLGGSATVSALTGMSTIAACFLIPFGVAVYVFVGGMRATLFADWSHTAILYILLLLFAFSAYCTSPAIGSVSKMYELLQASAISHPVEGNAGGSYLTLRSTSGLIFGVLNLAGNFSTVFADQGYFQRAIASEPQTAVKAYLIGGLCWFSIPFCLSTCLGLSARALNVTITAAEVTAGLPAPKAAAALLGSGGAGAMLLLLFMAVTSATSAELVAASSIITFDIYKVYVKPQATGPEVLRCSHFAVAFFALVMAISGLIFFYIGVGMGYIYELMGCLLGSSVVPISAALTWSKTNKWGALVGVVGGQALGIIAWVVTAHGLFGEVTLASTGEDFPMLAGNLVSIGVGAVVTVVWSLISPENFDFEATRALGMEDSGAQPTHEANTQPGTPHIDEKDLDSEKNVDAVTGAPTLSTTIVDPTSLRIEQPEIDFVGLNKSFRFARWSSVVLFCVLMLIIPLPLFGSSHVFSVQDFTAYVSFGIAWALIAACVVVIYPLWESRKGLRQVFRGIWLDVTQNGSGAYKPEP